ncbi:MAG: hypothetical protein ACOCXH_09195 [Cyclobacteriaceae bacterium]
MQQFPNTILVLNFRHLILTGYRISDDLQKAIDQGPIQQYFKKPFGPDLVDHEIQNNL